MWSRSGIFFRNVTAAVRYRPKPPLPARANEDYGCCWFRAKQAAAPFSSDTPPGGGRGFTDGDRDARGKEGIDGCIISSAEAKKLMRLVNVEELKMKLGMDGKEIIGYRELIEACLKTGVAHSKEEAAAFAQVLDNAGIVLLFRDKVHLHPEKVLNSIRSAVVPLVVTAEEDEEDPRRKDELKILEEKKAEIDIVAHKQVRCILWMGLGLSIAQVGLFFRLTFWEYSWDVMEPVAFFTYGTGIVIGYAYFLFTSRDPTYQDFMQRLFLSRQRKLFKKHNFDLNRLIELRKNCKHGVNTTDHRTTKTTTGKSF